MSLHVTWSSGKGVVADSNTHMKRHPARTVSHELYDKKATLALSPFKRLTLPDYALGFPRKLSSIAPRDCRRGFLPADARAPACNARAVSSHPPSLTLTRHSALISADTGSTQD